jgi:diacylglycerol O-acyltransferase
MERLSSLDGVFLAIEDRVNPMNIGTVAVFDGPAPPYDEVVGFLTRRVASVPRCRQRVREPAGLLGRAVWIDDVRFDPLEHIHRASLSGRGRGGLEELAAELLVSPLDRDRPLWQLWVVDDLPGDRWAVVAIAHHCMVDGIAGSDLLGAVLTKQTDERPADAGPWAPSPEPTSLQFALFNLASGFTTLRDRVRGAMEVLGHPRRSWNRTRDVLAAAKQLWYRQVHTPTSLAGPIGTCRRWTHVVVALSDVGEIRAALGGTVNDVIVTAVSSGFQDLLVGRGEQVADRTITAMVPVSLRLPTERGQTGNRVANVHARLPMDRMEPASMLRVVREHLEDLKHSHEIEATGLLMRIGDYVPRVLADVVARGVIRRQRNVETVITNVPGPRSPMYLGGSRMLEGYPVAPIAGQVRITVAIWSYCDNLYLGITGDRDTAADVDRLGAGIADGITRMLTAARRS